MCSISDFSSLSAFVRRNRGTPDQRRQQRRVDWGKESIYSVCSQTRRGVHYSVLRRRACSGRKECIWLSYTMSPRRHQRKCNRSSTISTDEPAKTGPRQKRHPASDFRPDSLVVSSPLMRAHLPGNSLCRPFSPPLLPLCIWSLPRPPPYPTPSAAEYSHPRCRRHPLPCSPLPKGHPKLALVGPAVVVARNDGVGRPCPIDL